MRLNMRLNMRLYMRLYDIAKLLGSNASKSLD
jgi:hypothetical protein